MGIQPKIALVVILLSTITYPLRGYADGDFADTVISSLKKFDSNVSAIQDKGFGSWLSDHISDRAWSHVPDLFGDMSDKAKDAQTVGKHLYEIDSRGMETVRTGVQAIDFSADSRAMREAEQSQTKFWDWLPDEKRELNKQGLQMSMPEPLKKLADKVETFYNNAQWVTGKLAQSPSAIDNSVASITSRVQGYVADVKNLGLEPGSDNYQVAATATDNGNPVFASDAEAPVTNDAGVQNSSSDAATSSTSESPSPRHSAMRDSANASLANGRMSSGECESAQISCSAGTSMCEKYKERFDAAGGVCEGVNAQVSAECASAQIACDAGSSLCETYRERFQKHGTRCFGLSGEAVTIERQRQADAYAQQLQASRDNAARQSAFADQARSPREAQLRDAQRRAQTTTSEDSGLHGSGECSAQVQSRVQSILEQCANSAQGGNCELTVRMAQCADRAREAAGSCAAIASQALQFCLQNKQTAQGICSDPSITRNLCSGGSLNSSAGYAQANPLSQVLNQYQELERAKRARAAQQPATLSDPNAWFNGTKPKSH